MRILQLVHQYVPEFTGGTELYTQQLSQELIKRGHEVAVFYRRPGEGLQKRAEPEGLTVWSAGCGKMSATGRFTATFGQRKLVNSWTSVLNEFEPDLVHVQHLMGLPTSLIDILKERAVPYLITFHDYWWVCANAQLYTNYDETICAGPDRFLNCGRCTLARGNLAVLDPAAPLIAPLLKQRNEKLAAAIRDAAALLTATQFVSQTYTDLGVTDAIAVEPLGIAMPGFTPGKRESGKPLKLIYLGNISPQKGLHVAIEAVNQLPANSVTFTIYGGLETFPAYVRDLRALATHPGITFAGRLDRKALWTTIAAADAGLIPSQWYETFVITIDEMFAVGVPVIASGIGVLTDRVQDGVNGLLVTPNDVTGWLATLKRLLTEPTLLPRLREGIRPVQSIAAHVAAIEARYRNVVAT